MAVVYAREVALPVDDGIGKALLEACREHLGDGVGMGLLSVPGAVGFYDKHGPSVDLHPYGHAYFMNRKRGV